MEAMKTTEISEFQCTTIRTCTKKNARSQVKTTVKQRGYVGNGGLVTYRFHVVFNSKDQCLFQLPEFIIRCWVVWEE